jgi:cytochrome oxidase assembly protein ShyY1
VFKFLLRPNWVALTLVCLLALPAFKALSDWQWRRLHQRQAWNAVITGNQAKPGVDAAALPSTLTQADQWRTVKACGTWDTAHQVLVRKKSFEAHQGFWVTTPLHTDAVDFVIVRGWIAAGETSLDSPAVPAPPTGHVCTTSRLRITVDRSRPRPSDVPAGQVDTLIPREFVGSAYGAGYGELVTSSPDSSQGLTLLPPPEITEGPHRSYALQWLFFMVLTVVGWVILVRTEVQRRSSAN